METKEVEQLIEYYKENKLAHAYLITTNNSNKCLEVLLNVIKNIFCSELGDQDKRDSLCHLIDINNLPSLKIIEPDGKNIKKNQILELKSLFSRNSQYTKDNFYIIKSAEKLNKESANTMLKFLEEPEGNLYGFFITNNKDNVMLTIQSRCQHIDCMFNNELYETLNIESEVYEEYKSVVEEYLYSIEKEKKELILYNKKYLSKYEKDQIINILKIILEYYKNALINDIKLDCLSGLSFKNIEKKINIIIEILYEINYNVNLDMLLDRFVIEMDGVNNEGI